MPHQIELFAIENPCVGVCKSNKKGYCFGCLRSRTERQLWHQMNNEQKRDVLRLIANRQARINAMKRRQREQMSFDFDEWGDVGDLFDELPEYSASSSSIS